MKTGPKPNPYSAQEKDYATQYVQEYTHCGKPNCRCATSQGHGPYWFSYHYSPTLKRKVKKYIGKELPPNVEHPSPAALGA